MKRKISEKNLNSTVLLTVFLKITIKKPNAKRTLLRRSSFVKGWKSLAFILFERSYFATSTAPIMPLMQNQNESWFEKWHLDVCAMCIQIKRKCSAKFICNKHTHMFDFLFMNELKVGSENLYKRSSKCKKSWQSFPTSIRKARRHKPLL